MLKNAPRGSASWKVSLCETRTNAVKDCFVNLITCDLQYYIKYRRVYFSLYFNWKLIKIMIALSSACPFFWSKMQLECHCLYLKTQTGRVALVWMYAGCGDQETQLGSQAESLCCVRSSLPKDSSLQLIVNKKLFFRKKWCFFSGKVLKVWERSGFGYLVHEKSWGERDMC